MPIKKATCPQFAQPTVGMGLSSWPSYHIELASCAKLCAVFCEPLPSIIYCPENMDIVAISAARVWGNFLIPYSEHSWGSPAAADRLLPAEQRPWRPERLWFFMKNHSGCWIFLELSLLPTWEEEDLPSFTGLLKSSSETLSFKGQGEL